MALSASQNSSAHNKKLNRTARLDLGGGASLVFSEREKGYTSEYVETALRKYLDALIVESFDIGEIEGS